MQAKQNNGQSNMRASNKATRLREGVIERRHWQRLSLLEGLIEGAFLQSLSSEDIDQQLRFLMRGLEPLAFSNSAPQSFREKFYDAVCLLESRNRHSVGTYS